MNNTDAEKEAYYTMGYFDALSSQTYNIHLDGLMHLIETHLDVAHPIRHSSDFLNLKERMLIRGTPPSKSKRLIKLEKLMEDSLVDFKKRMTESK